MTASANKIDKEAPKINLFDYSPSGIFVMDDEGRYLDANSTACSMLGYNRDELITHSIMDFLHYEKNTSIPAGFSDLKENRNYTAETQLVKKNGDRLPVSLRVVESPDGTYMAFCTDITAHKQVEYELMKSRQQLRRIIDTIPALITYVNSKDLRYTLVNQAFAGAFDMSPEQIRGKQVREIIGEEAYMRALPYIERARSGEHVTFENTVPVHGEQRCFNIDYIPELDELGIVKNIIVMIFDITDRKRIEETLEESENRFRTLFEQAPDINLIINRKGIITDVNHAVSELTGYGRDEIIGRYYTQAPGILWDDMPDDLGVYKDALEGKPVREIYVPLHHKNGAVLHFEAYIHPIMSDGSVAMYQMIMRNVTKRKIAEEALRESEARFRNLLQDVQSVSVQGYAPDGTTQYWNKASEQLYGYSSQEAIGRNLLDLIIPPEMREDVKAAIKSMAETGQPIPASELPLMRKDGSRVPVFSCHTIIRTPDKAQELFCMDIDLTELKKSEKALRESENRFHRLAANARDMIYRMSLPDGKYEYVNSASTDITGYTPEEYYNGTFKMKERIHPEFTAYLNHQWKNLLQGNMPSFYEYKIIHKNGSERWLNQRNVLVRDEKGFPVAIEGIATDISDRKQAEDEIKKLLSEKELILKEVHHRIKNNMNTMIGLLSLQADAMENPAASSALLNAESRLRSMAVLYDKLYRSENLREISINEYVPPLIDEIVSIFQGRGNLKIIKQIDDFILDAKKLQPLGIIINEILTNILKYAFPSDGSGLITISAALKGNMVSLIIQDNGIGMPVTIDFDHTTGFGLMLISMLTEQMGGKIKTERGKGTKIILEFEK